MRKINFFSFTNEEEYKDYCLETATTLITKYDFYYSDNCNQIKDIEVLVKSKKDYYAHRFAIYYIKDECYFVLYRKNDIAVEVLTDCNGCQIAHFLAGKCKKIKEFRIEEKQKELDKMIKESMKMN